MFGRYRRHAKLSPSDYVEVHGMFEENTVGFIARHFGIGVKQVRRILNLNLSNYAVSVLGEQPLNSSSNLS